MRIVMIAPFVGDAFGQERSLRASCVTLQQAGHDVFLVGDTQRGELPPCRGAEIVPGLSSLHTLSTPRRVSRLHRKVFRFLRAVRPDVVHFHDTFDFRLLSRVGRHFPCVLTAHTVALSCPSSARLIQTGGCCFKKSGWACVSHNKDYGCLDFLRSKGRRYHAVHSFLLKKKAVQKYFRLVFSISNYVTRTLLSDGWTPDKIHQVPNAVIKESLNLYPKVREQPILLFAGRLTPLKGLETVLTALQSVNHLPWVLWVCGEGSERERLETLTKTLGLESRVIFWGRLSAKETQQKMAEADLFLAPNLGPEAFGLSVAEACTWKLPVIASDVPALNEILVDEVTGLLVPPGDAPALAQTLEIALRSPAFTKKLANRAHEQILARHSAERHLKCLLEGYKRALETPPAYSVYYQKISLTE